MKKKATLAPSSKQQHQKKRSLGGLTSIHGDGLVSLSSICTVWMEV